MRSFLNTYGPSWRRTQSGKASLSPSITLEISAGDSEDLPSKAFVAALSVPTGTKPQLSSNTFRRLSVVTPSLLVYTSSSNEPDTQIRLPFFTRARTSLSASSPIAQI